jgi:RNA polymerase sigma-70 factor, ECF subfamily
MLLQMIADRDPAALEAFYDRHAQIVYNLSMRIVRDAAAADEVLQDTFWQVWQKAGEYRGGGAVAAWLYRIARNKSLDRLRREKVRPQVPVSSMTGDEQDAWATLPASTPSVEQEVGMAWQRQQLRAALREIPTEQRRCLELAYFDGMSQHQIATEMDTPVGTVKTRIRLGVAKLAQLLRATGFQAEDVM